MQGLFSTETLSMLSIESGYNFKTKPQTQYETDDSLDTDERQQSNSPPPQESESREDCSEGVVDFEGPVVSSSEKTELFSLILKRNWPDAVKRCRAEGAMEAMTWIVEENTDGSIRWKLLPIHQVSF